jgi:hypothetical protein
VWYESCGLSSLQQDLQDAARLLVSLAPSQVDSLCSGYLCAGRAGYTGWRLQDLLNGVAFYIGLGALLNIKSAFSNQPIEVAALRPQFQDAMGLGAAPQLLIRFGYAAPMPRSLRRPLY